MAAAPEQEDFSKLSTEELILHKSWKARVKGYEDSMKMFARAVNEKDSLFNKYLGLIKNFVSDSNQVALEKGLDAAFAYVENAAVSPKTAGEVCPLLVQKCLGLPKQKLRDKAQDILLMYIEVEKPDVVIEALLEGLQNKNPKLVSASLTTFTTAISQFGPKVVNVKPLMKLIGPLMEHRDVDVRGKTKILAIEIYRWIGAALKPQLQTLTPIQLTELENEFANVGGDKPTPSRYLRSQKPKENGQGGGEVQSAGDAPSGQTSQAAAPQSQEVDPWEYLTPFALLSKMPTNFYEQLESKKWSERKEKLDELEKLLKDNPRLDANGTYGELISVINKIIAKDSNINVVGVAGKCMAGIAGGLRKKFGPFASMVAPVILEKFKEKKPVVLTAMVECIDAVSKTTTLDALTEDLLAALDSKTPSVKVQTIMFLSRYFSGCSPTVLNKKVLKTFSPSFIKLLSDSDAEVRDNVCVVLGTAMKVVSEKILLPFLDDVTGDHLKMDKIRACCEKAEVKVVHFGGAGDASPAAQATADASKKTNEQAKPRAAVAKPAAKPKQDVQTKEDEPQNAPPKKTTGTTAAKGRLSTANTATTATATRKVNAKETAAPEKRTVVKGKVVTSKVTPDRTEKPKASGGTVTKSSRPQNAAATMANRSTPKNTEIDDESPERLQAIQTPEANSRAMFRLELDKLGLSDHKPEEYKMPELCDHAEAEKVLAASPIQLPPSRFRPASASTPMRRDIVTQSMDASTALDTAINSITSIKIEVAIQALAQLDEIIKDASKCNLLEDKVDQLLMAIYFQFRMAFNTHMMDESVSREDVIRLYRHLCVDLLSLLSAGDLVKDASEGTLKDLICQLFTVLLDERLETLPDGTQIIRSLNLLLVKLVVQSDPTSCMVALIRLLRDTLHSQTSSLKFQGLVIKCLWKLSLILHQDKKRLNIGRILAEAHAFFVDFPMVTWKQKNDNPPRTIRTILNKLVEIFGDKVLDYVDVIDKPESSEVVACLKKSLLTEASKNPSGISNGASSQEKGASIDMDLTQQKAILTDIFKKIGATETSKEGLNELYEFKQRYPDFDIAPWLKKSSDFFRDFITRGLEQIATERLSKSSDSGRRSNYSAKRGGETIVEASSSANITGSASSVYLEQLQKLRVASGLEPLQINLSRNPDADLETLLPQVRMASGDGAANGEPDGDGETNVQQPRLTADEVNEFKARLERVKRGQ